MNTRPTPQVEDLLAPEKKRSKSASAERKVVLEKLLGKLADGACTLGELFRSADVPLERTTAQALARRASVFARNVSVLGEKDLAELHVCERAAAAQAMHNDDLLVGILRRKAAMGAMRAHTLAQLSDMVAPRDKSAFHQSLTARDKEGRWPAGVATVKGLNTTLVFLLSDIVGAARPENPSLGKSPDAEPSPKRPSKAMESNGFAHDFGEVFDKLRRERRVNLVTLAALRSALPGYPREVFDRELYELRRANAFVLESYDGRHGKPKADEIDAAIEEGGRRFVYVSRREDD